MQPVDDARLTVAHGGPGYADRDEQGRLLKLIHDRFGYDFHRYAAGSLARRISRLKGRTGLEAPGELEARIDTDPAFLPQLLDALTVNVSGMFRDPGFFLSFRRSVIPFLRTYPGLRIWVAGCAHGEEAYSLAIILREEGLDQRAVIYATDVNPASLECAREGVYRAEHLRRYAENYRRAGGQSSFSDYFTVARGYAAIDPSLKANICFAHHNLVTDRVFGDMQAILCRNVLIYFDVRLQSDTLRLLHASLRPGGFLGIGVNESLSQTEMADGFEETAAGTRIYRKRTVF